MTVYSLRPMFFAITLPLLLAVAGSAAAQSPPTQFFAVRQAATGDCVVAVGVQAIAPGDKIFGTFSTYQPAKIALENECRKPAATPVPVVAIPVVSPTAIPAPVPFVPAASVSSAQSAFASPILAVPKYDNDESTKGIFFVNLDTGSAFFIDRVKHSPLSVRSRSLNLNAFSVLGRIPGRAALNGQVVIGEIRKGNGSVHALFLVDTTTGAAGYISDLASRSYEGKLQPVNGAPAASIASNDGRFTLVMIQGGTGKTKGVFLCHASSQCLYFDGVGDLDTTLTGIHTNSIPSRRGALSALAIISDNDRTEHMLLLDHEDGSLHHVVIPKRKPAQLEVVPLALNLLTHFPREAAVATPQRFVAVPVTAASGATEKVLIIDVGSGALAFLEKVRNSKKISIEEINANIYDHMTRNVARPRVITAVPKLDSSGATEGAWLFDSVTGKIIFIDKIDKPKKLELKLVEEKAR